MRRDRFSRRETQEQANTEKVADKNRNKQGIITSDWGTVGLWGELLFAEAVLQALNIINNSIKISLISPHPVVIINTSFPRTLSWICIEVSPLLNFPSTMFPSGTPRRLQMDLVRVGCEEPPRMTRLRMEDIVSGIWQVRRWSLETGQSAGIRSGVAK